MAAGKVARRDKIVEKKTYGQKVKLINMSGEDRYCATTGALLPKNGMVVAWEGNYYTDWRASERAAALANKL